MKLVGESNLLSWLKSALAPFRGAAAEPGRTVYFDRYDAAQTFVQLTDVNGARSTYAIHAILQRDRLRQPTRWYIDDITLDTS